MNSLFVIGLIVTIIYFLVQFAKQEAIEEFYDAIIIDVEGRLNWAASRTTLPFGMLENINTASKQLALSKYLWGEHKYHQAYQIACESQQAIENAQILYISMVVKQK
ncbi:MAG: hypothetical protein GY951_10860 [Psychromonas sp.]|nr:hypothetical protein [Alteromonadales bacterium]MCP5078538.1 hypothetical protein [Psychromonas sp.]